MLKKLRIIIVLAILISGLGYYYYTCERPVQLPGKTPFPWGWWWPTIGGGGYGGPQGLPVQPGPAGLLHHLSALFDGPGGRPAGGDNRRRGPHLGAGPGRPD